MYGWRHNPLYHSGALTLALLAVVLGTGVYLLFFYRIGAPYASVARLTDQVWLGRWIRTLHRYASDAAVVFAAIHAFRMLVQERSWGPRALAWVSGLVLLGVVFVCGWTGYVMIWDAHGLALAREGARLLDALPVFSEPISRGFVGERAVPNAFFFLNLFLHVALPVALGLVLWVHVARLARPALWPPRALAWGGIAVLLGLSLVVPAALGPEADLLRLHGAAPFDWFYSFWLPASVRLPVGAVWGLGIALGGAAVLLPWLWRPPRAARPGPSVVNERLCSGCRQCYLDCPYEAIAMVERDDGRAGVVARVDPALCVSCGLCAGSCAPMGVGPPGRTGRDQLAVVRETVAAWAVVPDVVLIGCARGAGGAAQEGTCDGAPVVPVECVGNLHTSVVEYLVRSGVRGVLIVSCPARDCWNREGVRWLNARLYDGREAELKERVDRRRVRVAQAGAAERREVRAALDAFRADLATVPSGPAERAIDLDTLCEPAEEVAAS